MIRLLNRSIGRIATLTALLVASHATVRDASADPILNLTGLTGSGFYITTTIPGAINTHAFDRGGNVQGTLDGVALPAIYCVDLTRLIGVPSVTTTTVTNNGIIFGNMTGNAASISWLIQNIAPTAVTAEQQGALQAAIWRTEYGAQFELDGADNLTGGNSATLITLYQNTLALLGTNTAPVADVLWISPTDGTRLIQYQGLVAAQAVPEPSSLLMVSLGGLGLVALQRRGKSADAKRSV